MGRGIAMSTANANIPTIIIEKSEKEIQTTMKNIEDTYKKSSAYKSGKKITSRTSYHHRHHHRHHRHHKENSRIKIFPINYH